MKWKNAGNECQEEYERIKSNYCNRKLYIYGAGMIGGRIYDAVKKLTDFEVAGFIDRNLKKEVYKGLPVSHWNDIQPTAEKNENILIIMGLEDGTGLEIKQSLLREGWIEEGQCVLYRRFMMHDFPILLMYQNDRFYVDLISMIITERCTLRCEKCSIMLPYLKDIYTYPIERLKEDADVLFRFVDFVGNYTVTGGEPLLDRDLPKLLAYLGEHYRDKIGSFKIITNGMLEPDEELLQAMKKYSMAVEISDYTKAVPSIKENVLQNVERYQRAGIPAYFLSEAQWVDFGFESVDNQYTEEQAAAFFDYCRTRCRGYAGGKIRYCVNAYFAERAMGREEDSSNYFDIKNLAADRENKRKLVEFDLGYNRNGYLDMCRHCNGTCEINKHFIEVGVQCRNL